MMDLNIQELKDVFEETGRLTNNKSSLFLSETENQHCVTLHLVHLQHGMITKNGKRIVGVVVYGMSTSKLCWCSNKTCTHCFQMQTVLPEQTQGRILVLYLFLICVLILTLFHWSRITVTWRNAGNLMLILLIIAMFLPLFL